MSAAAPLRRPFGLRTGAVEALPIDARPIAAPATTKSRPRLVIVAPARATPGRLPFLILIGTVLVGGLLMLLMLHTLAAQDGFKASALQQRLNTLTDTEQGLAQQVQNDSSPAMLRRRAAALGMVPSTVPSYKRTHNGRVVGLEQPAYVPVPPAASTQTASTQTASTNPKTPSTSTANGSATGTGAATTTSTASTTGTTATATGKASTGTSTGTTATTTTTTTHHHTTATSPTGSQQPTTPTKAHHKPHQKATSSQ